MTKSLPPLPCLLMFVLLMVGLQTVHAQPTLEELKGRLATLGKTPHDDTLRADTWMTMAMLYSRVSMDSCRDAVNNAMRLSKRIGYKNGYARAVNGMANVDCAQGKMEKAFEGYSEALEIYKEIGAIRGQASCHTNLGLVAANMGHISDASSHYLQAITFFHQVDSNGIDMAIAYLNLGELYVRDSTTLSEAQYYLQKAIAIADKVGDVPIRITSYLAIGAYYQRANKTTEALGIGLKTLQMARESNDVHGVAQAYAYLTDTYTSKKDYPKALSFLNEAEATFEKIDDKLQLINIYQKKGDVLLEMGNAAEALETYKKLLPIAKKIESADGIRDAYLSLAKAYKATGDTERATYCEGKAAEAQ